MDNKMIKKILFISLLVLAKSLFAADSQQTPDTARLVTASSTDTQITVSWTVPEDNKAAKALLYRKTYDLPIKSSRSGRAVDQGDLIAELNAAQQSYVDQQVVANKRYYYRVIMVDVSALKSNPSLPAIASLKDVIPPQKVESINGKMINATHLSLRWIASESDDVLSYRVYRSRSQTSPVMVKSVAVDKKNGRFLTTAITQKKNSSFIYHYAVAAVDGAGNVAPLSDTVSIRLPDSIAPANPLLLKSKQQQGLFNLSWRENTENDMAGYKIYRKNHDAAEKFALLHKGLVNTNQFTDNSIDPLTNYRYRVSAVDKYGNESKAGRGIAVRTVQFDQPIPAPARLVIKASKKGYPTLNWRHDKKQAGLKMRVFRSDGGDFKAVSRLLDKNRFTDTSVIVGRAYKYQIKTVSALGLHSAGSNTVMWTGGGK